MEGSTTSENDPDIEFCVTLVKVMAHKVDLERLLDLPSTIPEFKILEDVALAQHSTTKTKKNMKRISKGRNINGCFLSNNLH